LFEFIDFALQAFGVTLSEALVSLGLNGRFAFFEGAVLVELALLGGGVEGFVFVFGHD